MLKDLIFSDIYLGHEASWFAGVPGALDPVPAPPECAGELAALRKTCVQFAADTHKIEFAVREAEITYRVSTIITLKEIVYVLRRFPAEVPNIDKLGLHPALVAMLLEPRLTGLLVLSGAYGQGKTTTASSVVAARLAKFGGVGVTIEDPPEMPLEGRHGEGVCYQTWVEQGGFGHACSKAARWAPSIIFVGEVRDPETATEALRASLNGRLVVCTTHADSVVTAIERLYTLANGVAGNSEDVASLLSHGLLGVLHQRLEGDVEKHLKVESLWLNGEDTQGARNMIYSRKFSHLTNEVQLQLNRTLMTRRVGK